jgi:hypothetical protein
VPSLLTDIYGIWVIPIYYMHIGRTFHFWALSRVGTQTRTLASIALSPKGQGLEQVNERHHIAHYLTHSLIRSPQSSSKGIFANHFHFSLFLLYILRLFLSSLCMCVCVYVHLRVVGRSSRRKTVLSQIPTGRE